MANALWPGSLQPMAVADSTRDVVRVQILPLVESWEKADASDHQMRLHNIAHAKLGITSGTPDKKQVPADTLHEAGQRPAVAIVFQRVREYYEFAWVLWGIQAPTCFN